MPKYFLFLAFLISCSGISQNAIAIKGKICDSKSQLSLEAATVYLSSTADSTVIDYTITDKKGAFLMNTRKITKPFFLKVSYVGYQTYKQQLSFKRDLQVLKSTQNYKKINFEIYKL